MTASCCHFLLGGGISFIMVKSEKFYRYFVSNVVVLLFVVVIVAVALFAGSEKFVAATNKEYNGTIYAGDTSSKNVTLMINVYWNNDELLKMLEILKNENVQTTFFIGGGWAKENLEILKQIVADGHEIGNHGTNHKEHGNISYEKNLTEIQTCHEIVKHITGQNMELFAPPGGSYSKSTTKAAETLGYKTIMWTRDTIDWRDKNTELIFNRATINLSGGDLILMHPTANSVEALPKIISFAKEKGFNLTTVTKTLGC